MKWFLNRLSEPSSMAGFAAFIHGATNIANHIVDPNSIMTAIAGLLAILMPEKRSTSTQGQ